MEFNKIVNRGSEVNKAKKLKEMFPLYPTIRREKEGKNISFSTLIRKRYDSNYYLIPMKQTGEAEAKTIHELHSNVHYYLMLGLHTTNDIIDDNQINESERLYCFKKLNL
jgi:hypothetical protein